MYTRPAEKIFVVMLQTPLKFLGQKSDWRPILGSIRGPQPTLGPGAKGLTGGVAPRPKIAWGHTFPAPDQPQNWSPNKFWPKNLSGV